MRTARDRTAGCTVCLFITRKFFDRGAEHLGKHCGFLSARDELGATDHEQRNAGTEAVNQSLITQNCGFCRFETNELGSPTSIARSSRTRSLKMSLPSVVPAR